MSDETVIEHEHEHAALPEGMSPGPETMRSFRRVLVNTLVSNVTTSFLWFALTFWAYLETRSVLATSIVGGSFMLLIAVLGPLFGSFVDHHRKRNVMLLSSLLTLVSYLVAVVVYVLAPRGELTSFTSLWFWAFVAFVLFGSVVEGLRNIALSTTVTLLVPVEERDRANGLVGTVAGIGFMITSVFSGLAIGFLGMGWTLAISVALTAVSVTHLMWVRIPEREPKRDGPMVPYDVSAAIRVIRGVPGLFGLILFATLNNLVGGVFMALMDPYGLTLFSVQVWGIVLGVTSVGFIIGGAWVARFGLGSRPLRSLLLVNVVVAGVGMLFTVREWQWLYVVGILLYMCFIPIAEAAEQTVLQRVVPFASQGRVFGFASSLEAAAAPITAFMIGPIAQNILIPYMASDAGRTSWSWLLGNGTARGIALVFVLAGVVQLIVVGLAFGSRPYRLLSKSYAEAPAVP